MFAGEMKLRTFLMIAGCGVLSLGGLAGAAVVGGGLFWGASSTPASPPEPTPMVAREPTPAAPLAVPSPPSPAPVAASAGTGRDVDTIALGYEGKDIGTDKLKDVTKGKPYKVNVYQDAGNTTVNRVKIDLDRDDKWDEKITFKPGEVSREVAPADDESYTERYLWNEGWVGS